MVYLKRYCERNAQAFVRKKMSFKEFLKATLNKPLPEDKVEYFKLRSRVSGYILTKAQQNSPTCGYNYEADITKFWEVFQELKANCDYELSFNTLMMKVLSEGLKAAPKLNSHVDFNTTTSCGTLIMKKHIDIAMPVLLDNGETFPIKVRETEDKSLKELSEQIAELFQRLKTTDLDKVMFDVVTQRTIGLLLKGDIKATIAQTFTGYVGKHKVAKLDGRLKPAPRDGSMLYIEELNEGSVCMTNWGVLYDGLSGNVTYTPLLYPQVFLFAMGVVKDTDYAFRNEKGEVDIATKKTLPITLMFDHRIGAFNDVMPFIKKLDEIFQNPEIIKEW